MSGKAEKRVWIAIAAAAVMAVGCSAQTGGKAETGENVQAEGDIPSGGDAQEEGPNPSGNEEKESGQQKPTSPDPSQIQPFPDGEREEPAEPMENGKRIVWLTDVHYLADSLTDRGEAFQNMVEHGDGKLTNYVWEITDAALEEIPMLSPDVVILSGDLTLEGERKSHEELAQKLDQLEQEGIQVVVIPGNHDINNPSASVYSGTDRYPAEPASPKDFERIYGNFGYLEAASRDAYSLSYTYDLGPSMRLLMLDTCQYETSNKIGGMIKTETYQWIEEQLEKAREDSVILLPVAHHNLLQESKVYVDDCTIEHSEELIHMLEEENIPLFLSGHLHVQHFMRNHDIGIYEIVTSSLSTPPCQYGILEYRDDETFSYHTRRVDIEKWARKQGSKDENLLNFHTYSPPMLKKIFYNQAYDAMKDSREEETGSLFVKLTEEEKDQMARVYGDLNAACYAGKAYEVVKKAKEQPGYQMWREYCYPAILYEYLEYIVEDAVQDYNTLHVE